MHFDRLKRREFIGLLGGVAAAWPMAAHAQRSPSTPPIVGILWHAGSAEEEDVYLSVLRKAFHDLGYIEGKNIRLEHRFPAENPDRFRTLARERRSYLPAKRSFQPPHLGFAAFGHLFPSNQMAQANHTPAKQASFY
jgi:hypothetical protein